MFVNVKNVVALLAEARAHAAAAAAMGHVEEHTRIQRHLLFIKTIFFFVPSLGDI